MIMRVEDIADVALEIPSEARALLADRLVESLDPAEDGYIHNLWADEANRRLKELRSGSKRDSRRGSPCKTSGKICRMKYEFHPEALFEFEAAADFYSERQKELEFRFLDAIQSAIHRACEATGKMEAFRWRYSASSCPCISIVSSLLD